MKGDSVKRYFLLAALLAPAPVLADGYGFMTPSKNIYCNGSVLDGDMGCTIVNRSGPPAAPRPLDCGGYWGHDFNLSATGPAYLTCSDYAPQAVDYTDIAPYGVTAEFGGITCTSESTGLTCRNRSGHGFFLSRRRQSTF